MPKSRGRQRCMIKYHQSLKSEKLKSFRERFNLEIERDRDEFYRLLKPLIEPWKVRLPDLRDVFRREEIESLLSDSVCMNFRETYITCAKREVFVGFVARCGYKDEPDVDENGRLLLPRTTPLHRAASRSNYRSPPNLQSTVRELFKIYARLDVNYTDEEGLTHFHVACRCGCDEIVEKFLRLGRDPNCLVEKTGDSPLHLALKHGHKEASVTLLRGGADPNLANRAGETPLHVICHQKEIDYDLAKMFFEVSDELNWPVRVNARDEKGWSPLHRALYAYCSDKMVELLLRRGSDPNLAMQLRGWTPLHIICQVYWDAEMVKTFFKINDELNQRVHLDARDEQGCTALELAAATFKPHVVDVLLDTRGADLSGFVFPTNDYMGSLMRCVPGENHYNIKLRVASGALVVVENIQTRGYELNRSEALAIMKAFDLFRLFDPFFDNPVKFARYPKSVFGFYAEEFAAEEKELMMNPSLSLYELIRLRPEAAAKRITFKDYHEFAYSNKVVVNQYLALHLCEKMSRGFFRRWALDYFFELVRYRLPMEVCEIIIDESFTNKDLLKICLAVSEKK